MIRFMWQLYHKAWLEYCDTIHAPPKLSTLPSLAQITLLALVEKYKIEANILPKHKKIFFDCTKLQYQKWSIKELQRWLSTARKIIQRYKFNAKHKISSNLNYNYFPIIDPNTNLHAPTKQIPHTIIKAKKTNHLKESSITKYYKPTATTPTTTLVSKLLLVRNTSLNLSTFSIRVPSIKQLPTNTIATTSTHAEHIPKNFRSDTLHSIISSSNLQKFTAHQLDTNTDTINKNVVSDSKQTRQKNRAFLRKRSSRIHLQPINNTTSTTL